jgi:radical SAM protein with 4Fe4S-binding SPASM domain
VPHPAVLPVSQSPGILWVELTSKCPVDCVFCSRQARRGAGAHLPFTLYSALLDDLVEPRKFILNYSGESTVYPDLIPAIRRARASGAWVELVSALVTAPDSLLNQLSCSGLNRLTVSVHATDPQIFQQIYRYSSFRDLKVRLERFIELCRESPLPPAVDLAFVAMDMNLPQLQPVAALAADLRIRDMTIFPIIRRDEIPARFDAELDGLGTHRPEFGARLGSAVASVEELHPDMNITVCNAGLMARRTELGTVPIAWPWDLPSGALIYSCEQNPWETTHILSSGDVVACEVLDKTPLGNLHQQPIREIWHGDAYQRMRERYRRGEIPECRSCPWKKAYRPRPLASEILAARGLRR